MTEQTLNHIERLDAATRRHMLQKMIEIRTVEGQIQELFLENVIRGTTHLADGQEAVSVGMAAVAKPEQGGTLTRSYPGHGPAVAVEITLRTIIDAMKGQGACSSKSK